jgi:N-acetylglucosamine-6-phosphate deacetylase
VAERELHGRLVLADRVAAGRIEIEDGRIAGVELDPTGDRAADPAPGPLIAPGFADLHVHGWGGHGAMGPARDLDGMARALASRGVTAFLPTAVSAPLEDLAAFADRVRAWLPDAPADGAAPLGFNLEGPFLAPARRGAHDPAHFRAPATLAAGDLEPVLDGLRIMTVAPELPGALELIGRLSGRGVVVSLGHSGATMDQARAGYLAGARATTHLFNAMSGIDHRAPGLAVAALVDDEVHVELIADGEHVDAAVWPIVLRMKPAGRLVLVSDAVELAGTAEGRGTLGGLAVEVRDGRCRLVSTGALAGSLIALDSAVRNLVRAGFTLPVAVAAAGANPLAMLGVSDRGRIAPGQLADLVELGDDLAVTGVLRAGIRLR